MAVDEYLTRSRSSPLDISLFYMTLGASAPPPYFVTKVNTIVQKVLAHSHRWREVLFDIPAESVQTVFSQLASDVPRLTSMIVVESSSVHRKHTLRINLSSAHHLERLYIFTPTDVNWGNTIMDRMRDINVTPTSLSSFLQCIDKCPSVISVEFCTDIRTLSVPLAKIYTRRLSSLVKCRLVDLDQDLFSGLLDSLHLPALKQLDLSTKRRLRDSSSFVRFINRSQPPLEILSIIICGMPTADLLDCLHNIPRLTVLRTNITHFSDVTIQRFLTPSSTHGRSLCPNLMSLWLIGGSERACQNAAELVVHRWHNASGGADRIRHVWISDSEKDSFLDCDGITECGEEGFEISSKDDSWTEYCGSFEIAVFIYLFFNFNPCYYRADRSVEKYLNPIYRDRIAITTTMYSTMMTRTLQDSGIRFPISLLAVYEYLFF
ncbi:hypothetical protein BD410DRAFT_362363 [Rickenella mellea]|uniref:F-box domain-containing protein n=1 Tax=Rickenella mellea TaxID=50990 RepID=A0A4Y7Q099_9AGAM|nr:hypothetical protein BD410DRAFT_362363 [Rickenella mellea]